MKDLEVSITVVLLCDKVSASNPVIFWYRENGEVGVPDLADLAECQMTAYSPYVEGIGYEQMDSWRYTALYV